MPLRFLANLRKSAVLSRLTDATARMRRSGKWRALPPAALVVDDDPAISPLVEVALNRFAISSESVHDGAAALSRLRAQRFDLVILDLGMPGVSGLEVLRALKAEERFKQIRVIVLTASDNEESLARSFGYGADDFIAKPFKKNELGMRAYRLLYPMGA